jgi:hypothetical protein
MDCLSSSSLSFLTYEIFCWLFQILFSIVYFISGFNYYLNLVLFLFCSLFCLLCFVFVREGGETVGYRYAISVCRSGAGGGI